MGVSVKNHSYEVALVEGCMVNSSTVLKVQKADCSWLKGNVLGGFFLEGHKIITNALKHL